MGYLKVSVHRAATALEQKKYLIKVASLAVFFVVDESFLIQCGIVIGMNLIIAVLLKKVGWNTRATMKETDWMLSSRANDEESLLSRTSTSLAKPSMMKSRKNSIENAQIMERVDKHFEYPVFDKSALERDFLVSVFRDNYLFMGLGADEDTDRMLDAFEKTNVPSGEIVCRQGDPGDYLYIIMEGSVDYLVHNKKVGSAEGGGKVFGELALMYHKPRSATVQTTCNCTLWRVDMNVFRQILAKGALDQNAHAVEYLRTVPMFSMLELHDLKIIADLCKIVKYTEGSVIMEKAAPEKAMVLNIMKAGKVVKANREIDGLQFDEDEEIGPGAFFGYFEGWLMHRCSKHASMADVIALEDTTCLALTAKDFTKTLGSYSHLINRTTDKKILETVEGLQITDLCEIEYVELASAIKEIEVPEGTAVYRKGQNTFKGAIYIIRKGTVTITLATGAEHVLEKNSCFGFETLLQKAPLETVVANEDCEFGMISRKAVEEVVQHMERLDPIQTRPVLYDLDNLTMHSILGQGSFGLVYLVSPIEQATIDKKDLFALKVQSKRVLLDNKQVQGVMRECSVMAELNHPFIVKLINVYMTPSEIIMLMRLIPGCELYELMQDKYAMCGFPEQHAKFYAAGILEALTYMHNRKIAYRDLKAENVMVDGDGYPVVIDLGFAKLVQEKTFTMCGTPLYIAPECILGRGHNCSCDYWSLGVLIYEMLEGTTPFERYACDQGLLFKMICRGEFRMGQKIDRQGDAADLIQGTMVVDPMKRIGSFVGGASDIKSHAWFEDVDFYKLNRRKYRTPWVPPHKDWGSKDKCQRSSSFVKPSEKEQALFEGFTNVQRKIRSTGLTPEERARQDPEAHDRLSAFAKTLSTNLFVVED